MINPRSIEQIPDPAICDQCGQRLPMSPAELHGQQAGGIACHIASLLRDLLENSDMSPSGWFCIERALRDLKKIRKLRADDLR